MTKPTKWPVHPAKTQISLGIPVWSESSLCTWRNLGCLATYWGHSKGSGQAGRTPRLISVFAGRTYHFVGGSAAHLVYRFLVLKESLLVWSWPFSLAGMKSAFMQSKCCEKTLTHHQTSLTLCENITQEILSFRKPFKLQKKNKIMKIQKP